jgi:hypothetical protein
MDTSGSSLCFEKGELYSLAIEVWRLKKRVNKIQISLGSDEAKAINNSIDKMELFLNKKNIKVLDYTNVPYNEGLNVDVLSIEKGSNAKPLISETIEPSVTQDGKVIKRAKVIVSQ